MRLNIIHDLLQSLNTLLLGHGADRRLCPTQLPWSIQRSRIGLQGNVRLLRNAVAVFLLA